MAELSSEQATRIESIPKAGSASGHSTSPSHQASIRNYRSLTVLLFILNTLSALLFILFVNHVAYDDANHLPDVHRYAREGVSANSIRAHINAPGPTAYLWMAVAVRMFPGNELRSARAAILVSWLLLGAGILAAARYTRFPSFWYAALLSQSESRGEF